MKAALTLLLIFIGLFIAIGCLVLGVYEAMESIRFYKLGDLDKAIYHLLWAMFLLASRSSIINKKE